MSKRSVKELLRGVPFFAECSEKDLAQVSRLTTTVSVPAGKAVASQGALGQEFFVIVEGTVTVAINDRTVARLGPGDFFGEIALLDGRPRTATVTAETDLEIEVVGHRDFVTLVQTVPSITENILKGVAARLRDADTVLGAS
jgi:CRP-like cAMP-binding protein